jgi:hypothetical protein
MKYMAQNLQNLHQREAVEKEQVKVKENLKHQIRKVALVKNKSILISWDQSLLLCFVRIINIKNCLSSVEFLSG